MFSTVKKLSIASIILSAINIFVGIAAISYLVNTKIGFTAIFSLCLYICTASAILLCAGCALYSAAQDIRVENDYYLQQITDMKKRIDTLENR